MSNLTPKDYWIAQHVQAEIRREAEQQHLADAARAAQHSTIEDVDRLLPAILPPHWVMKAALIALVLLAILAGVGQALAQGAEPVRPDAGGPPEAFAEAMRAYREGCYALNHGEYVQAVEWLALAVEGIPAEVMAITPAYQDMYWDLGSAQEAAGYIGEALISYQTWLSLAGDEAAPWTVVKVQAMEAEYDALLVADTRS